MARFSTILEKLGRWCLDLLFPRKRETRFLERAEPNWLSEKLPRAPGNLPGIISAFDYRHTLVKTLVWEIKFKGNRKLSRLAGQILCEHLLAELDDRLPVRSIPLLIPVPLAPKRLAERGFNQAKRLAEAMAATDGGRNFTLLNAARRVKETASQTRTKSRAERLANMAGAFSVPDPNAVRGKHCVILDDVTTTGATIGELRKALLAAGARSVIGLTLAH